MIARGAIALMLEAERTRFVEANPASAALARDAARHWHKGVPFHWMLDWGTPFPLFADRAQGAQLWDVDGHRYEDFCLGDTGSMFGHSPPPVARALAHQAPRGLTYMLSTAEDRTSAAKGTPGSGR